MNHILFFSNLLRKKLLIQKENVKIYFIAFSYFSHVYFGEIWTVVEIMIQILSLRNFNCQSPSQTNLLYDVSTIKLSPSLHHLTMKKFRKLLLTNQMLLSSIDGSLTMKFLMRMGNQNIWMGYSSISIEKFHDKFVPYIYAVAILFGRAKENLVKVKLYYMS